jgi:uncharacterized protein YggE
MTRLAAWLGKNIWILMHPLAIITGIMIVTMLVLTSFGQNSSAVSGRTTIRDLLPFDPSASEPNLEGIGTKWSVETGNAESKIGLSNLTEHTISASGRGILQMEPDLATIYLRILTTKNNEKLALDSNLAIFRAALDSLTKEGNKGNQTGNLTSQNISSTVALKYENASKFTVTRNLVIITSNIQAVPNWLDKAVKAGVNVERVQFGLSDHRLEEQRINVMERAMGDAWKNARDAAILLGVKVTGVKSLSIDSFNVREDIPFPGLISRNFSSSWFVDFSPSVGLVLNVTQSFLFS